MKKFDLDTARGEALANKLEANIASGDVTMCLYDILDYYEYYNEIHRAFITALDQAGANCFAAKQSKPTPFTKIRNAFSRTQQNNDMQPFYEFVNQYGQPRPMVEQMLNLGYVLQTLRDLCDQYGITYRIAQRSTEEREKIMRERKENLPQLDTVSGFAKINLDPGPNVEKGLETLIKNSIQALRDNKPARPSETFIGFELKSEDDKHGFACGITRNNTGKNTISISFINREDQRIEADFDISYPTMHSGHLKATMERCVKQLSASQPLQIQSRRMPR